MFKNITSTIYGMGISAFAPKKAMKEKNIEAQINNLAKTRNTSSWYSKFKKNKIAGASGKIILRVHEIEKPKGIFIFMPGTNAYVLLYGQFLLEMAKQGYTVIGFNPRGHGNSEGKRGSYTIPELLDDYKIVVEYCRKKYKKPITVSGSSQGGIVAFYYALTDSRIEAAICHNLADLSSPESVDLTRFGKLGHGLKPALNLMVNIIPELPIPMPFYLNLRKEKVKGFSNAEEVLLKDPLIPWFVRLKTLHSLGNTPPPDKIINLKIPTLIIQAEKDSIFPLKYISNIAKQSKLISLIEIPNTYHYLIVDEVEKVVEAITNWKKNKN